MKTQEQIENLLNKIDPDANKFPRMPYEEGIREALEWVLETHADADEFESEFVSDQIN